MAAAGAQRKRIEQPFRPAQEKMRPIVVGYHGCDRKVALAVVTGEQSLTPSRNHYDWLGHGIYYWEDDPAMALQWAKRRASIGMRRVSEPAVLGAAIDLTGCLNLVQTEAHSVVSEAFRALKANCEAAGKPMPVNAGFQEAARYLDCSVFETLHALREDQGVAPYCSVRAFFPEGEPAFPGAGIRARDHIQICVRNPARILGHFIAHPST
jgi:hypothetical protein